VRLGASPLAPAGAFAACTLIWGSTWLAIKVGYAGMGALTSGALRFGLAALMLAVLMLALRLPLPGRAALRLAVLQAVLLFLLNYGLVYWGEQFLDSGLTAVLFAVLPLCAAGVAHVLTPGERLTARKLGGVALGMAGLAVVFGESLVFDPARLPAMLAIVAAALFAAVANVLTHRDAHGLHPASYTMPAMALGAVLLEAAALGLGEPVALPRGTLAWASVLYLSAVGSVVAFLAYFWLLQRQGPSRATLLILLTPLVALFLGAALLGEQPGASAFAGTALVLAGVWATVRAPPAAGPAAPEPEAAAAR
jgi:drug/metabolite transporter (DMT)-like permease